MPGEFTSSDLMTAMLGLRDSMDHGFAKVDARFDGVDGRIDAVETRLTSIERELRGIKDWTLQVDQRFEAIAQAARITGL